MAEKEGAGSILVGILVGVIGGLAAAAVIDALTSTKCPICGQRVNKGARKCPNCQTLLEWK